MTPEQENEVIGMLEDYKRVGWLWRGVAQVAKYIAYFAGATTAVAVAYKTLKP